MYDIAIGLDGYKVKNARFEYPEQNLPDSIFNIFNKKRKYARSAYTCPICHQQLAKTIFIDGNEVCFNINQSISRALKTKRVFPCIFCEKFFFAEADVPLDYVDDEGYSTFFILDPKSSEVFSSLVDFFGEISTGAGRSDYNESIPRISRHN